MFRFVYKKKKLRRDTQQTSITASLNFDVGQENPLTPMEKVNSGNCTDVEGRQRKTDRLPTKVCAILRTIYLAILKEKTPELGLFTNFKVFFPVVSKICLPWPT